MPVPIAGDQGFLKLLNRTAIVNVVRAHPGIARVEIAARTGLTKMTVGGLVGDLVQEGWLREGETHARQGAGRPAQALYPNGAVHALLGVEVGVGYLNLVVTDICGGVLQRHFKPYHPSTPEKAAEDVARMIRQVLQAHALQGRTLQGVGLAVPGLVNSQHSTVNVAPNLGWHDVPFLALVRRSLPDLSDVWVLENEANAAAIGEYAFRAGEKPALLVQLMLGRGVGCGVMIDGRILRGPRGYAGEVGHTVLRPDGPRCRCGNHGCAELYVSERALSLGLTDNESAELTIEEIISRVEQGGRPALDTAGRHLGVLMANLLFTFNPSHLIVGGPLSLLGEALLGPALRELHRRVPADLTDHVDIALCERRVDASAIGAAAAALEARLNPAPTRREPASVAPADRSA
ncbi:ROK family transcriptional regulator [Deinococcus peraridilitoris]|uniref:Transcriptional regulator/sugar kinase n=1 Tax=Deinococcus peraridilitoris (strain DSM 19664 / LMG 22246 / CIP 109416 / KR-200) TaxID=937777 RepID=K9ZYR0_DEIPD|nr:ROK family transcriptional regulator [Deinococcus peraridilitoris]AFZ66788.1 transcriptional regulator/sugar kinase [Deinococcus peraridilitoris DSM 19664]